MPFEKKDLKRIKEGKEAWERGYKKSPKMWANKVSNQEIIRCYEWKNSCSKIKKPWWWVLQMRVQ